MAIQRQSIYRGGSTIYGAGYSAPIAAPVKPTAPRLGSISTTTSTAPKASPAPIVSRFPISTGAPPITGAPSPILSGVTSSPISAPAKPIGTPARIVNGLFR